MKITRDLIPAGAPIRFAMVLIALILGASTAVALPITIAEMPAYNWYHGCGPTAAGSIIGYWDLHGYPDLFTASGSDVFLTDNVQDQISSPEHNARYDPEPDDTSEPQSWNSIADWFRTSGDPLGYGSSYLHYSDDAFEGYANYRGYLFDSWYSSYASITWMDIMNEIAAGRPLMFLVDSSGDAVTDHFVPVLGYDIRGDPASPEYWYGVYTTWSESETIAWYRYQPMSSAYTWGVGFATFVHPITAPIPEPASIILVGTGLGTLGLAVFRRRKK